MQVKPRDQKVMIVKGLPASGKSTYAKQLVATGFWVRVNKDDLRAQLHNGKWTKGNEKLIEQVRDAVILEGLRSGKNIVVDDTNLSPRHEARIRKLLKDNDFGDVTVEINMFVVPVEECIKRDLARPNSVGEKVIRSMYNQFIRDIPKPEYLPGKPKAVICDLDGTLALFGNKNPYDRDFINDVPNQSLVFLLNSIRTSDPSGTVIIVFSGRNGRYESKTRLWLFNSGVPYDRLFMRSKFDNRKDSILKKELYEEHVKDKFNVVAVFDDRPQVCTLWYELGLPLFKFGDPDSDF